MDKRLHCPVQVESVLCADFKNFLPVPAKLQSNFIPKYQRRYIASDCASSRKLESLHPILHIVCLVQIIPVIRQVEEFYDELKASLNQTLLKQEYAHDFEESEPVEHGIFAENCDHSAQGQDLRI